MNRHAVAAPMVNFFTADECEEMLEMGTSKPLTPGLLYDGNNNTLLTDRRSCTMRDISLTEQGWEPYIDRIDKLIRKLNDDIWKLDLTGFEESFKIMRYQEGDHFQFWHMDCGPNYAETRKITAMFQLVPPSEYEGGLWEFMPDCRCGNIVRGLGSGIVFPSVRAHRLTPITKGEKYSLVCWMSGPPLR